MRCTVKSISFSRLTVIAQVLLVVTLSASAGARDSVLPAGTILQCTLNEPNFSSATVEVDDPVLCHLREITEFGQLAFPRDSYLIGHLEAVKEPGHFVGKGYLYLRFDRIGLPSGDLPVDAKIIAARGHKIDKEGKIKGKGHAKRDVAEWLFPPLWPWKVIMLPARGPRPKLKGETVLSLRLMDDVQIPQATTYGRESHSSDWLEKESLHNSVNYDSVNGVPKTTVCDVPPPTVQTPNGVQRFGPEWHFFGEPRNESFRDPTDGEPGTAVRDGFLTNPTALQTPRMYTTLQQAPAKPAGCTRSSITLFVMRNGAVLSLCDYTFQEGRITYALAGGAGGVMSAGAVDWATTLSINAQRGQRLVLRSSRTNAAPRLGF
jgi:hypothetical protein